MAGREKRGLRNRRLGGIGAGRIYPVRAGTGQADGGRVSAENKGLHQNLRTAGRPLYVWGNIGKRSGSL